MRHCVCSILEEMVIWLIVEEITSTYTLCTQKNIKSLADTCGIDPAQKEVFIFCEENAS